MAYTTIDDPSLYFQVQLYTGTGSSQAVTLDGDTDMALDLLWIHNRDAAEGIDIYDRVRGVTSRMRTSGTAAEDDQSANSVSALGTDGFTVLTNTAVNASSNKYVAYCWKAGTTSGITTNAGTDITPSAYSFNATSGVSAIAYTANNTDDQQIPHGLGVAPHMILSKCRSAAYQWGVYHHKNTSAPETDFLVFNDPDATSDDATRWSDQAPDSVNWTVGNGNDTNKNTETYIAYLFTGKQGFSKFGGYTGNGNADGPFVYTGFRPAFVLIKNSGRLSTSWTIYDNKRPGYNSDNAYLLVDANDAEASDKDIDLLSNGFKPLLSNSAVNTSGDTYIYMAFAEAPFVNSNGVPCNAR